MSELAAPAVAQTCGPPPPPRSRSRLKRRVCVALYAALFLGAVVVPLYGALQEKREARAIADLNAIWVAQCTYFREDLDGDGTHDYAPSVEELLSSGALDPAALGSERYAYRVELGSWTWVAYADPLLPGDAHLGLGPMFGVMAAEGRGIKRQRTAFEFSLHRK